MEEAIIYFSKEDKLWSKGEYEAAFLKMPQMIADKIRAYDDSLTRQLKLKGKLQLLALLADFNLFLPLDQLCFTDSNRPYFHSDLDFNTAHSGDIVICGGLKNGRIGIDIEKIKPLDINVFEHYFTSNEWRLINESENKLFAFYRLWTRKEALVKAIGTGVLEEFSKLEVINDCVETDECRFYFHEIPISEGYIANMAASIKEVCLNVKNYNQK